MISLILGFCYTAYSMFHSLFVSIYGKKNMENLVSHKVDKHCHSLLKNWCVLWSLKLEITLSVFCLVCLVSYGSSHSHMEVTFCPFSSIFVTMSSL